MLKCRAKKLLGEYIFNTQNYMEKYQKLIFIISKKFNLEILAYCIMRLSEKFPQEFIRKLYFDEKIPISKICKYFNITRYEVYKSIK